MVLLKSINGQLSFWLVPLGWTPHRLKGCGARSVKLKQECEIHCGSNTQEETGRQTGRRGQDELRIRAAEWTPRRKENSEWLLYLVKCVQKSVAASQRHPAASLRTNSRWLEKVTMSKRHSNGETFSKWRSWGTWPLGKDLSLVKGTGWWVMQSCVHKTHTLCSHCLFFCDYAKFIGQFFFLFLTGILSDLTSLLLQPFCSRRLLSHCKSAFGQEAWDLKGKDQLSLDLCWSFTVQQEEAEVEV